MTRTVFKRSPLGARERSPLNSFIANVVKTTGTAAYIDISNGELITMEFNGDSWSQAGNALTISPSNPLAIAALNGARVFIASGGSADVYKGYEFDGADWSQFATRSINHSPKGAAALTEKLIAFYYADSGNIELLQTLQLSGSSINDLGAALDVTQSQVNSSSGDITALTNRTVVIFFTRTDKIQAYNFNGKVWTEKGSSLVIGAAGTVTRCSLTSLSETRVILIDGEEDEFIVARFDGDAWIEQDRGSAGELNQQFAAAAIEESAIAFAFTDGADNSFLSAIDTLAGFSTIGAPFDFLANHTVQKLACLSFFPAGVELTVTGVSPASGDEAGGTSVTITGTAFTGDTSVEFDGTVATNISLVSSTSITCDTPSGSGTVDVSVVEGSDEYFLVDGFEYTGGGGGGLTITNVDPSSGTSAGGTSVTVTGTGFEGGFFPLAINFDGNPASNISVINDTTATCDTPAGTGTVDVTVSNDTGSDTLTNGFTYT